jgi:hypothetical protein
MFYVIVEIKKALFLKKFQKTDLLEVSEELHRILQDSIFIKQKQES